MNFFGKIFGLMFVQKEKASALLFEFEKPTKIKIHSLFVFFSFVAVWLDEKNKVIETEIIKPFTVSAMPRRPFKRLIEIPLNSKYSFNVKSLISRR